MDTKYTIIKGLLLSAKDHINDMPEGSRSVGEVVQFDSKLGWFIVVDGNHSKWYKSNDEIYKDFDLLDSGSSVRGMGTNNIGI